MKYTQGFSSLSESGFRLYWVSTLATYAASQMDNMIKGWLVYRMTGSAADLGIVTLAAGVPLVIISFFGGVIADRVNKHKLLLGTQVMAGLIALTTAILLATNLIQFWHFIVLAMLQGITFAFVAPVRQSIIARLVRTENLMSAVSLSAMSFNMMGIAGPAAVGLLLTFMLPEYVYYIIVSFFAVGTILLIFLKVPKDEGGITQAFHLDLAEGFRFIGGNRKILGLLLIALVPALLVVPYIYMLPALALGVLNAGQTGLGFLMAMSGIGALVGSLAVGTLTGVKHKGALVLILLFSYGVCIALLAQFNSLPLAMGVILLAAISGATYMTLCNTLILGGTPPGMQGRVISIFTMTSALAPIGAFPMGAEADALGIPVTYLIAGAIATTFAVAMWLFVPAIKRIQ
ncbi:MAG: MFS transporter [Dehalococcoidia bacterium]|nr:MFS transporter [Dehalococcoidia bacterium]